MELEYLSNINYLSHVRPITLMYLRKFSIIFGFYILAAFSCMPVFGASMVVLYPNVTSPYSEIFSEIIAGVEAQHKGSVKHKALEKKQNVEELNLWVKNQNADMLIALGRRGYKLVKSFDENLPVVVGALPIKPNDISGVSLLADPKVLFNALKNLAPNIKHVHVVYSQNSEWLVELADTQSQLMGLNLIKIKAESVKEALLEYDKILSEIDVKTNAIWLPLDPITVNEQIILPSLLKRTWEQNIVLFSSKPAHAKRGALFSMFPNNYELGKQLAVMVKLMNETKQAGGVLPLASMHLAVNLRTAAHLGFEYKNRQKQQFYVTFPQ